MSGQDQRIEGSQLQDSQVQLSQAGRDAVSFQNSHDNQVTIVNTLLQLGPLTPPSVDWDWGRRLLAQKQLPEIRKRLTDTLGRDRSLMAVSYREQLSWVGRSSLEPDRVLQIEGQGEAPLDPRQLLIETFGRDDIAGKLLILGTPGAGKTTALLGLAEQLVVGALEQPKTVIPVLFELSTWRNDNQSIRDWLIDRLYEQHGGSRRAKVYEQWLDQQVLLPLMDGLDELGFQRQQKCTEKLQAFAAQYPHLVVCCRTKEFTQAGIKLSTLRGAIRLEPLSDEQIRTFLASQQSPLWSVLETTPQLQKLLDPTPAGDPGLLRIPLFIALAARVYDPQHPFATRTDLLRQYVDWQLSQDVKASDRRQDRDNKDWAYQALEDEPTRQRTQQTLAWMARQLEEANQVELLIEQIQPSWLETDLAQHQYQQTFGLIGMLTLALIVKLNGGPSGGRIFALRSAGVVGLIIGLYIKLIDKRIVNLDTIAPVEAFKISMSREVRREILESWKRYLIGGLMFGLYIGLGSALNIRLIIGLSTELIVGRIVGLISGLIIGLAGALIIGLIAGLKQDLQLRSRPNQGIWNSLKSCLWITLLSCPLGVACMFFIIEFPKIISSGVVNDANSYVTLEDIWQLFPNFAIPGIFTALLFGFLSSGGLACMQHACLRWVLWQRGIAPWNLAQFLNYCVERRLLQRVGGSYRFIHRELLDHFAARH